MVRVYSKRSEEIKSFGDLFASKDPVKNISAWTKNLNIKVYASGDVKIKVTNRSGTVAILYTTFDHFINVLKKLGIKELFE